jgi:Ca2+-binding EF-hand superfamily protein
MGNSGSNLTKELTEKNLDFLVGQTGLPREDIESILKIFNANESGSLDKKGFIRLFDEVNCLKEKKSYSTFRDEYTVSDFYKNFDRNNNGKITFNEFMLAYAIWNGGYVSKKFLIVQ